MDHQLETQPTVNRGEDSTQESAPRNVSDVVTPGEDNLVKQEKQPTTEQKTPSEQIAELFESMFDNYVKIMRDPNREYAYETHETGHITRENMMGKVSNSVSTNEILLSKLHDLERYVKGSINSGGINVDTTKLPEVNLPLDEIVDHYTKTYISEGIHRAMNRYDGVTTELPNPVSSWTAAAEFPAHISYESSEKENPESTNKFIEIVRHLGASAITGPIRHARDMFFSNPITIPQVEEASPEHPADPEDLHGDVLTVRLNKVKL